MTMDELARAIRLTAEHASAMASGAPQLSPTEFLEASYAAGGIYPALFGYALGAIALGFFVAASHWVLKLAPGAVCAASFARSLCSFESLPLAAIFAFSTLVGACCTYVQVKSWCLAFAHLDSKRQAKRQLKTKRQ